MYKNKGGRHYWFAKELLKRGYEPTIICANTYHGSKNYEDTGNPKYIVNDVDCAPKKSAKVILQPTIRGFYISKAMNRFQCIIYFIMLIRNMLVETGWMSEVQINLKEEMKSENSFSHNNKY